MSTRSIELQRDALIEDLEAAEQQLSALLQTGRDIVHDRAAEMEADALLTLINNISKEIEALDSSLNY